MTDDELIAALREEDAYNERFYEPDPLHKLSADRIEALVKELKTTKERVNELEVDRVEINRVSIILIDQLIAYYSQNAPAHRDVIDALKTGRAKLKGDER